MEQAWDGPFQILSLDGGGIKGIFSAAVLAAIEDDTKTKITSHFDLIAGTSTGGIIALGLGLGLRPHDLVRFYVEEGPAVFANPVRVRSVLHWVVRKFPRARLKEALEEVFEDSTLGDSSKRLVIPSFDLGEDTVHIFKTPHHERLKRDYKIRMSDVALATSAAPTYFSSYRGVSGARLVDGGVWANNPVMVGVAEAVSMLGARLDQISVLSLSTTTPVVRRRSWLNAGGKLPWAASAVEVVMRGQSVAAHNQACHLLGSKKVLRIDSSVTDGEFALDLISSEALIAKASHVSRHQCPAVEAGFLKHQARPYEAMYRVRAEN